MNSSSLEEQISSLASRLSSAERENLKLIFSMAAGGYLSGHTDIKDQENDKNALLTAQKVLPLLQKQPKIDIQNGIIFRGKAPFFSNEDLHALDKESNEYRSKAGRFHDHYVSSGAPVAREISLSDKIHHFLENNIGSVIPTFRANYLYYDAPGLGIDPHVDKDEFSLNILTMLEHEGPKNSHLILHPPGQESIKLYLEKYETLVFLADRVTHQRIRTTLNEKIRLVSFGYKLI